MNDKILTPIVMWMLLIAYVFIGCISLFVLRADVVPLVLSLFIAVPFWFYGPKIESHYLNKAAQAEKVISTEPAGTTLAVQATGTSGSVGAITSFETEKAIYRVRGNHTVIKGAEMNLQTRGNGFKYLCYAQGSKICMQLTGGI